MMASGCQWTGIAGFNAAWYGHVLLDWSWQSPVHAGKACELWLCNSGIWFHAQWSLSFILPLFTFIFLMSSLNPLCPLSLLPPLSLSRLISHTDLFITKTKQTSELIWPAKINEEPNITLVSIFCPRWKLLLTRHLFGTDWCCPLVVKEATSYTVYNTDALSWLMLSWCWWLSYWVSGQNGF